MSCSLHCGSGDYYVGFARASDGNVYTGTDAGELFWRGADIPNGLLDVKGDVKFKGDLIDEGGKNVRGSHQTITLPNGSALTCPEGYFAAGFQIGLSSTKIECYRL